MQVAVSLGCGFLCFMMTDTAIYTEPDSVWYLSSPLLPILFTILISYFIATCFFQVGASFHNFRELDFQIVVFNLLLHDC